MTRQRSSVVLLTVVALVTYLITPDRLPAAQQPQPLPAGGQSWLVGNAHDPDEHPELTSDGVTMLARADSQPAGTAALLPLAESSSASASPSAWRLGAGAAWQSVAGQRPDLHALQILRC